MSILCYHAIDAEWDSPLAVHPDAFAQQVGWLGRRRHVVDLRTALGRMDRRGRLVALSQFNIVLGILLAYLSNWLIGVVLPSGDT